MVFTQRPLSTGESFGRERRNASVTFFSDGDSGTPSNSVQAANLWYDIRDTQVVRFVADGCRKNLPLGGAVYEQWRPQHLVVALVVHERWRCRRCRRCHR